MRLIVTDTGCIWNHNNPLLEKFKDIVLVVCLNGKEVTDKYECFVSPYEQVGMGIDKYGVEDNRLKALVSVAHKLNYEMRYHDQLVFLTDSEPSTLYPFYVLKDLIEYNSTHLIAVSPFAFAGKRKIDAYYSLISDLSKTDSLLFYDSNALLKGKDRVLTFDEYYGIIRSFFEESMIAILNGIYKHKYEYSFFDFSSMSYVASNKGFKDIHLKPSDAQNQEILFPLYRNLSTLGLVCDSSYPDSGDWTKNEVERPIVRIDGKEVCDLLRKQRIRLAEANNIVFESEECPSDGPCAGTCEKCDKESDFLRKQLKKIPKEKRVYPQFDPEIIKKDWGLESIENAGMTSDKDEEV